MNTRPNIVGFAGSLRNRSFNQALLVEAQRRSSELFNLTILTLEDIPLYNDDLAISLPLEAVQTFRMSIQTCDGLLIACPEYNYSITGVLKNAIDWASTAIIENVLAGKKAAIMGASRTRIGTARSQLTLRTVLQATRTDVMAHPELLIARAQDAFDDEGNLINKKAASVLDNLLTAFYDFLSDR